MKALSLHVTGIVQGVGFRPFVYNLALARGLSGWVLNASDGVYILVEGDAETVDAFPGALRGAAPPMAVIDAIIAEEVEPEGLFGFEIRESRATDGAMTLVSPDIATCPECAAELFERRDRRRGYPFINCTNCGPRFTIISGVPYDRPATSMRDFEMCPECAAEYSDPADRRFHAQPDACFVCGPRLYLTPSPTRAAESQATPSPAAEDLGDFDRDWAWTPERAAEANRHRDPAAERARTQTILEAAAAMLRDGRILAIKGLGGYQLACDATNAVAVASLRERKHRWGKPLAIMAYGLAAGERFAEITPEEAALLTGTVRPIVLLRRNGGATPAPTASAPAPATVPDPLASGVADGLREIGVMLPYTPLHHLLLAEMGDSPLVMTSGNLSEEPIATGDAEALTRLGGIADAFLSHDREILSRYDDSVVRVVDGATQLIRRARGYAPYPLKLPFATDTDILGAGPEQKNTFTLLTGEHAFVSQHIGDMENAETLAAYQETLALYEQLFSVEPEIIAHDLHPEYLSTKWALEQSQPKVGVQHHHAHVVSVTAEHGVSERVIGVAFDGTGYGEDGRIWGGEILLADWAGYERFAHLAYVPMPGGSAAIKRPARMAIGTLTALGLLDHPGATALRSRLAPGEEALLAKMIAGGVNCPPTSSMGRLFDSVAALIGIADDARYEGEAAILLEAAADMNAEGEYEFAFGNAGAQTSGGISAATADGAATEPVDRGPQVVDPAPVLSAILDDLAAQTPAATISARFHRAVIRCIVGACEAASRSTGIKHVALCGGVFMNRIVLGQAVRQLQEAGLTPLTHVRLPANDGAVSFGQAVVAWARRHDTWCADFTRSAS